MKIFRFAPDLRGYAHPIVAYGLLPEGVKLGMLSEPRDENDIFFSHNPEQRQKFSIGWSTAPLSDFPWYSLQVPVISASAAAKVGIHPEHTTEWKELASRLRPILINDQPFFAIQALYGIRGQPNAFLPDRSSGISTAVMTSWSSCSRSRACATKIC